MHANMTTIMVLCFMHQTQLNAIQWVENAPTQNPLMGFDFLNRTFHFGFNMNDIHTNVKIKFYLICDMWKAANQSDSEWTYELQADNFWYFWSFTFRASPPF